MPLNPVASPGFRILKGETLGYIVWSNTAVTLRAVFRVIYDDGTEDVFITDERSAGSARAAVLVTSGQHRAKMAGMVVTASIQTVGTAVPQRGQTYVQALIGSDPAFSSAATVLFQGYIYAGAALLLGVYIEPGPAGGHGMIKNVATDNPAAGIQHASVFVPTGSIWRFRGYRENVTAFTAAAKSISITNTNRATPIGTSANFTPAAAAGRITCYLAASNALDTVLNGVVFPTDEPILFPADDITVVLNGIVAGDDLAAGSIDVEEWVMPN